MWIKEDVRWCLQRIPLLTCNLDVFLFKFNPTHFPSRIIARSSDEQTLTTDLSIHVGMEDEDNLDLNVWFRVLRIAWRLCLRTACSLLPVPVSNILQVGRSDVHVIQVENRSSVCEGRGSWWFCCSSHHTSSQNYVFWPEEFKRIN